MLERTQVYVDTSYLLASFYNSWETGARAQLEIDLPEVVSVLGNMIQQQLGQPIQRQLWYDGIPDSGPHRYQRALRTCDGVQLRAGQLIEFGDRRTQKAVDTRLVADMVLAGVRAQCSDIVLVSGDADMLPGVLEASACGVRVHLYGFGWDSMSSALRHACDSTTILDPREDFADCMRLHVLEGPIQPVVRKPVGDTEPLEEQGLTRVPSPQQTFHPTASAHSAMGYVPRHGAPETPVAADAQPSGDYPYDERAYLGDEQPESQSFADEAQDTPQPQPQPADDAEPHDVADSEVAVVEQSEPVEDAGQQEVHDASVSAPVVAAEPVAVAESPQPAAPAAEPATPPTPATVRTVTETTEIHAAESRSTGDSHDYVSVSYQENYVQQEYSQPHQGFTAQPETVQAADQDEVDETPVVDTTTEATVDTPAPAPGDSPTPGAAAAAEPEGDADEVDDEETSAKPAAPAKPSIPLPSMMAQRRRPPSSRYVPISSEIWESSGFQTPNDVGRQYAIWWFENAATPEQQDRAHELSGGVLPNEIDRPLLQFACDKLHEYTLTDKQRVELRDGFHQGIRGVLLNKYRS